MKPTSRLGRGLSSLIPTNAIAPGGSLGPRPAADPSQIRQLPLDAISPSPHQPRSNFDDQTLAELADSIRSAGVVQPILVRATGDEHYQIVAGERRWRAAKLAGLHEVPAIVRELTDAQSFELALVENLQRQDLAPLERAAAYQHYLDAFGGTIEELATRLGESRANVSNYMRLLKLSPEICYMLGAGQLGMGQARAIAGIADPQRQLALARLAARRNLSVRQVEELAKSTQEVDQKPALGASETASDANRRHLDELATALSKAMGLRVKMFGGRRKNAGRIVIYYANLDEFDRLAERLAGDARLD